MNAYRMGGLEQKISNDTYLQKASAEDGGYAKGLIFICITENNTVIAEISACVIKEPPCTRTVCTVVWEVYQ